jgi:lipopolysaccharide/colanic/teichoic acid biosynthesis glycosyltransferase
MVRLDLRYVRRCSLPFDLRILLKTVKVVLQGDGAN